MVSAVWPLEVMEGEHIPETDLTRHHKDLEEGERFESSDELRKMLFSGSPEGICTLVPSFMEGTEITLRWVCFL